MRRPREHIDRLHAFEPVTARGEQFYIARLRFRAAADVDDFLRHGGAKRL